MTEIDPGATMSREDIAVALKTSFRSSLLAPFSTPELRAAFEQLKDFVRVNATAGEIGSRAFRLVGESQEAIDREARELFEVLLQQSPPLRRSTAFGLASTRTSNMTAMVWRPADMISGLAMKRGPSVDFCGYWQR